MEYYLSNDALIVADDDVQVFGRGKTRRRPMPSLCESGENEDAEWEESAGDYVFRIVNNAIADREG